jgi:hypothetical protein
MISGNPKLFIGWVSVREAMPKAISVTHAGVGFRTLTQPTNIFNLNEVTHLGKIGNHCDLILKNWLEGLKYKGRHERRQFHGCN